MSGLDRKAVGIVAAWQFHRWFKWRDQITTILMSVLAACVMAIVVTLAGGDDEPRRIAVAGRGAVSVAARRVGRGGRPRTVARQPRACRTIRGVQRSSRLVRTATLLTLMAAGAAAQAVNYDEAEVPDYELPPLFVATDGSAVDDAEGWRARRRPELLERFAAEVYGITPPAARAAEVRVELLEDAVPALDGAALRTQARLAFERGGRTLALDLLLYVPAAIEAPVPAFLVANFFGNHSVHADPGIRLASCWLAARDGMGVVDNRATEAGRGVRSTRFPVEAILARGYALATFCYNDVDPDFDDGFANGAHALFDESPDGERAPDAWGAIGAWAWGYSRALDQLEREPHVDGARVAALGHSRLGKTALWAGTQDERFALVISNESGCGGAALWRRRYGETLERITTRFPHWFADALDPYADREDDLAVDQHQLLALVAPRPLYVASAVEDRWADPRGELFAAHHASPAWALFDRAGVDATELPTLGESIGAHVGYHVRAGAHDLTREDWEHFLAFADRHLVPGERDSDR